MPSIHHQLIISAPAEKVYSALTTGEGLAAWWTPGAKAEPQVDSMARFHFGPHYFKEMKITELVPSRLVKWTCVAGAAEWTGTALSFELQTAGEHTLLQSHPELEGQLQQQRKNSDLTLLVFHHHNWEGYTPMFAECNYTWAQFLRSLKLFCETGAGRPWPQQHRL